MPSYVLKILIHLESRDDLEARQTAAGLVQAKLAGVGGVHEIVLHAQADHKSIRLNPDGTFQDQWHKGGPNKP
jgi:hypothetical protein